MVRSSVFVACAVTSCLTIAQTVSADPIPVTGTMNITREFGDIDQVNLVGPGFAFDARVGWVDGYVAPFDCLPCRPGTVLNAGGILSTTVFGNGSLTLNGVTYPVTESLDSPATLYMELMGSFVVPPFNGTSAFVTVPFTMRSNVLVELAPLASLRGAGTATIFFGPGGGDEPIWSTTGVRYDFTDPAAVPEPATLLMVGGGLAAAAFARRRSRSKTEA